MPVPAAGSPARSVGMWVLAWDCTEKFGISTQVSWLGQETRDKLGGDDCPSMGEDWAWGKLESRDGLDG